MRFFAYSVIVALTHLTALITAIPVPDSTFVDRHESEIYTPALPIADTRHDAAPSTSHRLLPRVIVPGPPGTTTQLILTVGNAASAPIVQALLHDAYESVMATIGVWGDILMPQGRFEYHGLQALQVQVWNANNHQTTFGVLATTLGILRDYMAEHGATMVNFFIKDGVNIVGQGRIFENG